MQLLLMGVTTPDHHPSTVQASIHWLRRVLDDESTVDEAPALAFVGTDIAEIIDHVEDAVDVVLVIAIPGASSEMADLVNAWLFCLAGSTLVLQHCSVDLTVFV